MTAKYLADVVQTGTHYEGVPVMPGHHETVATPIVCMCCGFENYYRDRQCQCMHAPRWFQNEAREVSCEWHLAEKIKDHLYRT